MITVYITPDDLTNLRFGYRPLIEIPFSYRVLANPALQAPHRRWVEEVRQTLYGIELPYLSALVPLNSPFIPHFLTPTPTANRATIEDDLAELRATPAELIRKYVRELITEDGDSEIRECFLAYPQQAVGELVQELSAYWQRALAPYRSRMTSIKEGDVLYRARLLALEGPGSLFADLHPGVIYRSMQLEIQTSYQPQYTDTEFELDGKGLQLVPTIFSDECWLQIVPEWRPRLSFPVRGVGLWSSRPPNLSLELALGAGRARLLQALTIPSSTSELAHRLNLTSSAISQQLSRLRRAGLVEPHRSGKWVYYQLTQHGETLIALFERIL